MDRDAIVDGARNIFLEQQLSACAGSIVGNWLRVGKSAERLGAAKRRDEDLEKI